ncbi:MAG: glycosyltransferase family 2 protein [Pacificibacter sp.]|uniref:glycosyltransferase family 2 protein n=1 Tax=Pacificibacter sp. TaxID=1917866 RepID=UPI0032195148
MDPTKNPLGVITMVYKDYPMLKRWYDYYSKQVGAENLFVLSHGNDPMHREIAQGVNIINTPRHPALPKFDRRRWNLMADLASGLLNFYNWMLVTDVDEMVVVDPNKSPSLVQYLSDTFPAGAPAPKSISPMGLNIIHVPKEEPLPIEPDETILSRRRFFAPSRVYSKPILVRSAVRFGPGGHRNNLGRRTLSDDLYLLHLNSYDSSESAQRLKGKHEVASSVKGSNSDYTQKHAWVEPNLDFDARIAQFKLGPEDIELSEIRSVMVEKQTTKYTESYIWGYFKDKTLYQLPARFAHLV